MMPKVNERLAQCNRYITELTTRIEDMEASAGSGLIAADEFVRLSGRRPILRMRKT